MYSEFCKIKIEYKCITSCGKFCDSGKKVKHHNISQNAAAKNKKMSFNTNSNVFSEQSKNKSEKILEKHRILKDIKKGRGGPDISGLKKIWGNCIEATKEENTVINSNNSQNEN